MLANLREISANGYLVGHQDDPVYGVGWVGDSCRTDVKSVCNDFPAVIGFDLGHLELGDSVNPGSTLIVSYIGYITKEVKVGNQTSLKIFLEEDKKLLDEVVVVGYGTMKKSDLSGSSVSVGEKAIKGSVITSLDQSLQGRAAGVTAVSTSGAPGTSLS